MIERCHNCPNHGAIVGSRGPIDSPIVIVGESPGNQEVMKQEPFVGPSGKLLDSALPEGVKPYYTNAFLCYPGTRKEKSEEKTNHAAQCCHNRLINEISKYPRKVILSLGNPAIRSLTGDYGLKITQIRGKVFPSTLAERGIVAALHPAALMTGFGSLRQFQADVAYACALSDGNDFRKYTIPKIQLVQSIAELEWLGTHFRELGEGRPIAADSETGGWDGFDFLRDRMLCTGFCYDPHLVFVLPEGLCHEAAPLFDNRCRFVWHNGKFDVKFHRSEGVMNARVDEDTMLLSYALDETKGIHDLEQVAGDLIGVPDWKFMIKPYLDAAKAQKKYSPANCITYDSIPRPILYDYMSRDISSTLQIFPLLREQVKRDDKLELLYTQTLIPASEYLLEAEETGLKLDHERVKENAERLDREVEQYKQSINEISRAQGYVDVNPNSPTQLQPLLFDVLRIPIKIRGTDVKTLENCLANPRTSTAGQQVLRLLMKYRKVQKANSTYTKPAPRWVNKDGRVHTTYKIHGTATGRLASEDPNLLNIPRDPLIRGQFVCDTGNTYLEVDANQAELRTLAELSGDEELTRIYTTAGMSLHDEVTIYLYGNHADYTPETRQRWIEKFNCQLFPEKLYDEQKMRAKNVNFGIVYGITPFGLADQIDDTPIEAGRLLGAWMTKFKGAALFIRKCREAPLKNQILVTPFGRKKRFGVVSTERLSFMQNEASNFPEQSIASDIVLHTGIEIAKRGVHKQFNARIVNTIYDSILYEMPNSPDAVRELAKITIETLERKAKEWGMNKIPFLGEAKCGTRWGSLKDIKKVYPDVATA